MARVRSRRVLLIITILIAVTFLTLPWLTTSEDKVEEKNDTTNDTDEPYPHPKNILKVPKDAGRANDTTTKEEETEEKTTEEPEEMCPPNVGDKYITWEDDIIKVNMARLQADGWEKLDCRYQPFLRKMDHDVAFNPKDVMQDLGQRGEISFPMKHEFVKVECRLLSANKTRQTIYRLFSQVMKNDKLVKRDVQGKGKPLGVNVLLLCVGSMSQDRLRRNLPLTYRFLTRGLKAREFPKYHMVGKTSAALTAAMTGQVQSELDADIEQQHFGWYKDNYPWLWGEYKKAGYVTLLAEEMPSVWGYDKGAFRNQPTDHYLRTLLVQAKKTFGTEECVGSTPAHQATLDYTRDFTQKYSEGLMFVLTSIHETSRTQRKASDFATIDADISNLLKFWNDQLILQNSVVVVFSDLVDVATEGGTEDDRDLPFMCIVLPPHIEDQYPRIVASLKVNQNRSTSPFDLHKTLLEVLDYRPKQKGQYSRESSLFHEIPADRSCQQAGIPKEHCTGKYTVHPEI
ncbi:PREDICTED: uncharacterized protein LOC109467257 [Branchiostoma belcheri]|uniref:Uncharacterized protein LOC109467257 n=1 Tax=Branchiostoma belcheri TaxID=7741 RepID=A0A6P4Y8H0_BRABE|nr:PREDICTED: uncharacterized protein LOC109467257 [Branchiostoma belcheri]